VAARYANDRLAPIQRADAEPASTPARQLCEIMARRRGTSVAEQHGMQRFARLALFAFAACTTTSLDDAAVPLLGEGPPPCPDGSDNPGPDEICREECYRPPPPPQPQACTYEIFLSDVTVIDNQGASEGGLVLSADFAINGAGSAGWTAPSKLVEGQSVTTDQKIGTITVPWHQHRSLVVEGSFTEHDNGGANGEDDHGTGLSIPLVLSCPGAQKVGMPSMPIPLVGGNTGNVNGMVMFSFEAILVDADDDGEPNETDFTRTDCEEHNKGKLGEAVVIYEEYDDGPINTLAQAVGIRIGNAYDSDYDGLALIFTDNASNNFFGLDAALKDQADMLLPSTTASIVDAYRQYTRKGYAIDTWIFSHGMTNLGDLGPDCLPDSQLPSTAPNCDNTHFSAGVEEPSTNIVTEEFLLFYLSQPMTGTDLVPLRMVYMGSCYGEGFGDTWLAIGAKVTSGTIGVNVYPQEANDAGGLWRGGLDYASVVGSSGTNIVAHEVSNKFIFLRGLTKGCADVYSSMPCAVDFWTDDPLSATDKTPYPQLYYDTGLDGGANMLLNTTRIIAGDDTVSRTSSLSW
jgi:hypothetical protein